MSPDSERTGPGQGEGKGPAGGGLDSPDPTERFEAVRRLSDSRVPEAAGLLESRLSVEDDPLVVRALLKGLAATAGEAAAGAIGQFLGAPDPSVRATAVKALVATQHPGIWEQIEPLLQDPDAAVREAATWAAAFDKRAELAATLRVMLASELREERSRALDMLRGIRLGAKLELLQAHFCRESDPELLDRAAGALVREALRLGKDPKQLLPAGTESSRVERFRKALASRGGMPAGTLATLPGATKREPEPRAAANQPGREAVRVGAGVLTHPWISGDLSQRGGSAGACPPLSERPQTTGGAQGPALQLSNPESQQEAALEKPILEDPNRRKAGVPASPLTRESGQSEQPPSRPETPDDVRRLLRRETEPARLAVLLQAAARLGVTEAVSLAQPFAHNKDPRIRSAALVAVAALGGRGARDTLAFLVKDQDLEVASEALSHLREASAMEALKAVCALFDYREAWADRHAVTLFERLGEPAAVPFLIERMLQAHDPEFVTGANQLIVRWGVRDTFEDLVERHHVARGLQRARLNTVGHALGTRLGVSREVLDERFAPEPQVLAPAADTESPEAGSAVSAPARRVGRPREWTGLSVGVVCLLGWLWSSSRPPGEDLAGPPPRGPEVVSEQAPTEAGRGLGEQAQPSAPAVDASSPLGASLAVSLAGNTMPGLAEVEQQVSRELEHAGVFSKEYVRVIALERAERSWAWALDAADQAAETGGGASAFQLLEDSLARLDPLHLKARIRLLSALEQLCLQTRGFKQRAGYEARRLEAEKALMEICLKAARESGLPASRAAELRARLEVRQAEQRTLGKAVALFAGERHAEAAGQPMKGDSARGRPPLPKAGR